jgi:hypothetical protein
VGPEGEPGRLPSLAEAREREKRGGCPGAITLRQAQLREPRQRLRRAARFGGGALEGGAGPRCVAVALEQARGLEVAAEAREDVCPGRVVAGAVEDLVEHLGGAGDAAL